jgi:octaprenyl-diphosphate synthase
MQIQASREAASGLHAGAPRTIIPDAGAIFDLVAENLGEVDAELHKQLAVTIPAVAEIGRYLALAGGKRLRPLLTALGARAVGFDGSISHLSVIGELIHLGSLLHDDVVDDGQERRGKKAAQKVYGNPAVILTGDYCVARGLLLAAEHGGLEAVTRLAWTVTAMSEGEVTQLLNRGNLDLDVETYMDIVHKKSATLIAWCVAAGAWAKNDQVAAEALYTYGLSVGTAFQITDDVLDYTGDKTTTGKRRGQDLAERKITLPLLIAMERLPDLRERLHAGDPSPERIPALIEAVQASGATEAALDRARVLVNKGLDALSVLPPSDYRDALTGLAHHLVDRIA